MPCRPTYNILMYSHDTFGLGHIRRTLAIASNLRDRDTNILIITGSPIAGRFDFPAQIDFVRIPGMIKRTNEEYLPLSIKMDPSQALKIRQTVITATAKAFEPHLFIVDKAPLGLKREIMPTLRWLHRYRPRSRTVLGLRDIMDDAASTRKDWRKKNVYEVLEKLYSEIWVYGDRELYDPIAEYDIPATIGCKMIFTGYIARTVPKAAAIREVRREQGVGADSKLVVVTTGGGGDGYPLMDTFLTMLEQRRGRLQQHKVVLITGPFMPKKQRGDVSLRARRLNLRHYHFYRRMERIIAAADLVVTMGGYNTVCEILSSRRPALIIPREKPRQEQRLRAEVLARRNLVEYLPWGQLRPDTLEAKIQNLLDNPQPLLQAMNGFELNGIEVMRQRLEHFRSEDR